MRLSTQWRISLVAVIGIGIVALSQSAGQGAEWSAEPSISAKGEYNSNLLLQPGAQEGTHSYWVSPGVKFAGSTESLRVGGRVASDFVQYFGGRDTFLTNVYAPLTLHYQGERSMWDFNGGVTRDNTLRAELLQTGLVLAFAQRNLWTANPSWTYSLTERLSFQSGYQLQDATYETGSRLGLVDYRVHAGNGGLMYRANESDSFQLSGSYSRFLAPQGNNLVSDTYGVQFSGTHAFSERTTITAGGGPRFIFNNIDTGAGSFRDNRTIWTFNAHLVTKMERTHFSLDLVREVLPSGFGLLIQTDRAGANVSHELTDHVTVSLNASGYLTNSVFSSGPQQRPAESRFVTVTPGMTWRLSEWWTAEMSYTYGQRDIADADLSVSSHATRMMVTYTPAKLSIGR
jgi:hypothetical protein